MKLTLDLVSSWVRLRARIMICVDDQHRWSPDPTAHQPSPCKSRRNWLNFHYFDVNLCRVLEIMCWNMRALWPPSLDSELCRHCLNSANCEDCRVWRKSPSPTTSFISFPDPLLWLKTQLSQWEQLIRFRFSGINCLIHHQNAIHGRLGHCCCWRVPE